MYGMYQLSGPGLHNGRARSPRQTAETVSLPYGLTFRLVLLSTLPRDDTVTVS